MPARIIDGKLLAADVRAEAARRNAAFLSRHARAVGLAVVRVGEDPASEVYVRNKRKAAMEAGFNAEEHHFDASISQEELVRKVAALDARPEIDAVLVQLPLPKHIDSDVIIRTLSPQKDVDGFHPMNAGLLATGRPGPRPCTPAGCIVMLEHAGVSLEGKTAVVVGRSNIVGKPAALLLLEKGCTVTVCHSKTRDLGAVVGTGDIVIAAVGRKHLVKGAWIKPGAAVIDVGINRGDDGKLTGDVEYAAAAERAGWITPVPGGVGPMTIAMLLQGAVDCAERAAGERQ